jgi:hypothetical protein
VMVLYYRDVPRSIERGAYISLLYYSSRLDQPSVSEGRSTLLGFSICRSGGCVRERKTKIKRTKPFLEALTHTKRGTFQRTVEKIGLSGP